MSVVLTLLCISVELKCQVLLLLSGVILLSKIKPFLTVCIWQINSDLRSLKKRAKNVDRTTITDTFCVDKITDKSDNYTGYEMRIKAQSDIAD